MIATCVLFVLTSQPVISVKLGEALKCHWCIVAAGHKSQISEIKLRRMVFPLMLNRCYMSPANRL